MSVVLAVEKLLADVRAEFEQEGVRAPNIFGWRTPTQQNVGDRITWVPGDHLSGDIGKIGPPKWPGRFPRPIGSLDELFTVTITGFPDTLSLDDEEAQYRATRILFDAWFRAIYRSAHGTFEIMKSAWVVNRRERRAGGAIRVLLALQAKLSDRGDIQVVGGTLGADVGMNLLARTDDSENTGTDDIANVTVTVTPQE